MHGSLLPQLAASPTNVAAHIAVIAIYKLKTPLFRFRDCIGKTTTREIPRPTVRPTETAMSWRATWKPEMYDDDDEVLAVPVPDACCEAKCSRPPLPRPEGSWKSMPVICACVRGVACMYVCNGR